MRTFSMSKFREYIEKTHFSDGNVGQVKMLGQDQ